MNNNEIIKTLQSDSYLYYLSALQELKGEIITGEWEQSFMDFLQYTVYKEYLTNQRAVATVEASVQFGKSTKLRTFVSWLIGREWGKYFNFYTADDKLRIQTQDFFLQLFNTKTYNTVYKNPVVRSVDGVIQLEHNEINFRLVGEGNTGYPSHFSFIDDPYRNREDADSPTMREKIEYRFRADIMSRRQAQSMVVVLHSRWNVDDLIGKLKRGEFGKNVKILSKRDPAIKEDGTSLFPELRPIEFLQEQREVLGEYDFNALYMQEPILKGGNIIKSEWFNKYINLPERFDYVYMTIDSAFSTKTSADDSVIMCVGMYKKDLYIIDCWFGKWDFITLKEKTKDMYNKYKEKYSNFSTIYIESKASGQSLIQEFQFQGLPVEPIEPKVERENKQMTADKYTRLMEVLSDIKNGYVYIPQADTQWKDAFLSECMQFTGVKDTKDDFVDCTIYALKVRRSYYNNVINWGDINKQFQFA